MIGFVHRGFGSGCWLSTHPGSRSATLLNTLIGTLSILSVSGSSIFSSYGSGSGYWCSLSHIFKMFSWIFFKIISNPDLDLASHWITDPIWTRNHSVGCHTYPDYWNLELFLFLFLTCSIFRTITFDLIVEHDTFLVGLESLDDAVLSFLHLAFVSNMHYPEVELVYSDVPCNDVLSVFQMDLLLYLHERPYRCFFLTNSAIFHWYRKYLIEQVILKIKVCSLRYTNTYWTHKTFLYFRLYSKPNLTL